MDLWERIVAVHTRIVWLEAKRRRISSARDQQIKDGSVGPSSVYSAQYKAIEEELYELWEEKRFLLAKLNVSEDISWMSPMIPLSQVSPGRSRISKTRAKELALQSSTRSTSA